MCGICGIVRHDGAPDLDAVARMNATLVHRGPDDEGLFHRGPVALAARRLSIIDLDHGHQPIANEDGRVVVVQNGEIYNYRELSASSRVAATASPPTATPRSSSTSTRSTATASSSGCGGCSRSPSGTTARRRLLLARDRFGIKPLYYRHVGGELSFASELKAMLEQPGFSRQIDPEAIAAYLAFNSIPAPLTIFAEARKLSRASCWSGERGEIEQVRYARPGPVAADETSARAPPSSWPGSCARSLARLDPRPPGRRRPGRRPALRRRRLRRDHRARRGPVDEPLKTFSIGFEEAGFDELSRARLVAERYGTDHHELIVRARRGRAAAEAGRGLRRALRRLLGAADLPGLRAGRREGQGRALRRGRRRALRRLLHLRRRPARRPGRPARRARPAAGRGAAQLRPPGRLRLQSQALRPRRRPAAAGAPPRLEGDLRAAGPRRPARRPRPRLGPGRPLPRALRRDRRRRAAGPDAGRRPRHLHGRRPAGQDRPPQHGPLAGAAGPVPRPAGGRVRLLAAAGAAGPRLRQEAAAAPGAGAAAADGGRARAASRASRSRSPPGCAGRCSRSPAKSSRRRASSARAASTRRP